jgi:hypothetical protein
VDASVTFSHMSKHPNILPDFTVWKTVKLGTGLRTAADFRRALEQNGYDITARANDILGNPAFMPSKTGMEVDLVLTTVNELGFDQDLIEGGWSTGRGAYYRDIIAKALTLGYQLCPAEVGPQLRLQHPDQRLRERLHIGMEPIISHGGPDIFVVNHSESQLSWFDPPVRWLSDFGAESYAHGLSQFVFLPPRK